MENVFLKIIPYKGQPFVIEVFENTEKQLTWENFLTFSENDNYVFSDISYEFIIESKDISIIKDVCVYIGSVTTNG